MYSTQRSASRTFIAGQYKKRTARKGFNVSRIAEKQKNQSSKRKCSNDEKPLFSGHTDKHSCQQHGLASSNPVVDSTTIYNPHATKNKI